MKLTQEEYYHIYVEPVEKATAKAIADYIQNNWGSVEYVDRIVKDIESGKWAEK